MDDTNRDAQPKSLKPKDIARHVETTEVILNQARCKETGYAYHSAISVPLYR